MNIRFWLGLAFASACTAACPAASFATRVVNYVPGTLPASQAAYTNTATALGEPSRVTPGTWGGPVDPFSPPYTADQLLILGTNGSLTVEFAAPITDDSRHAFGLDFILYSGSGFIITNNDYTGGGITDGSVFGDDGGKTRISVSADGQQFFTLDPALATTASWPTDGEGSFAQPMDPALLATAFAGKNVAGLRRIYQGSAGGAGYALAWARDTQGNSAGLRTARFVRIESPDGLLKIDGISAVETPADFTETFDQDPAVAGWQATGNTTLFRWDTTNKVLQTTWDSSQTNSYFYRPLGMTLNKQDDFGLAFDIRLDSVEVGQDPGKQFTFELALGLFNRASALSPHFIRGTGNPADSPNLVEFDYFPDSGFGATISIAITSENQFLTANSFPLEMTLGSAFHVEMQYTAANQTLSTITTKDGASFGPINSLTLKTNFTDFAVDAIAVSSYSDQGADGSINATGRVENIRITLPSLTPPQISGQMVAGGYEASFEAKANWFYALERSTNLVAWTEAASQTASTSGTLTLTDTQKPAGLAWYRLRALRW